MHTDIDPGLHDCGCACQRGDDATCAPVTVAQDDACDGIAFTNPKTLSDGDCTDRVIAADDAGTFGYRIDAVPAAEGTCTLETTTEISPPAWLANARLCGPTQPHEEMGCGPQRICAPPPANAFPSLCIGRAGNHDCLTAAYPRKRLLFDALEDSRECTECDDCGDLSGACEGGLFLRHGTCEDPGATPDDGGEILMRTTDCGTIDLDGGTFNVYYEPVASGVCTQPGGGEQTGSITPENPYTVCCRD
ncbi:MAG: hypothetical protein V3V08_08420 [Nannocystaceae bacterium]